MSDYSNLLRKLRTDPKAFEAEAADAIDALLLRLDSATTATAAARHMYDQEYAIVARIWVIPETE